ncbi:MAG: ABC transporter ATP-binding protein [Anaerolineaceae bacterium]|nr:ABC transporter ATP-binding protein [Anaerolineaceae bacterium]
MLSIESISLGYGSHPDTIHDLTLTVSKSEMVALIGKNGAGKTTLLRGLTGSLPLRSGRILFNGRDLSQMEPRERARLISVVPQAAFLPAGYTVYETISHGRTPYLNWYGKMSRSDKEIIDHAVQITGLESFTEKEVSTLSGGEQQRVILARALAQNAPVMILDEPTSSLDIHYQVSLLELEKEICRKEGIAAIFIIHDLNLASRYADRVAILHNGSILSAGAPRDVLREDLISKVYDTPIRVLDDPEEGLIILPRRKQAS